MKANERYDAVHSTDSDSESITDVEGWSKADARAMNRRAKQKFCGKLKMCMWAINTGLLLAIVGLLVENRYRWHGSQGFELGGDITGFAPRFSQKIVRFRPDAVFAPERPIDFWSAKTQQAWLDMVPEGLGYVEVKTPEQYSSLPQPIHDYPNQTVFTTSMTHQLHCLYTILDAYNRLQLKGPVKMAWHINHCFEYLRQGIMCAGDVALEGAATTFPEDPVTGEDVGGSDGWDGQHVCKDYGQVYDYLSRETINHYKWISSD